MNSFRAQLKMAFAKWKMCYIIPSAEYQTAPMSVHLASWCENNCACYLLLLLMIEEKSTHKTKQKSVKLWTCTHSPNAIWFQDTKECYERHKESGSKVYQLLIRVEWKFVNYKHVDRCVMMDFFSSSSLFTSNVQLLWERFVSTWFCAL